MTQSQGPAACNGPGIPAFRILIPNQRKEIEMMASRLRRFLAWFLMMALCAGHLAIPAYASTEPEPIVITTPIEGGTETVTVSIGNDGSQTTTTEVNTANPETGTTHSSTTTEKFSSSEDGTQTQQQSTWDSTTTVESSDTTPGNPSVQTETNTTTTVEGSESTAQSDTYDPDTKTETIQGSTQGQETTDVTGTTVTTTTTADVLLEEESSTETTTAPAAGTESETSTGWVEGDIKEGQWEEGTVAEGETLTTTKETEDSAPLEASNPGEATIVMKPNGETTEVTVDVTMDQVLAGIDIPEGAEKTEEDGKVTVTTVTETSVPDPDPEVSQTTHHGDEIQTPSEPEGYQEGTVTEGNVTTVTEAILDESGSIIGYRITKTTKTEQTDTDTTESLKETISQETTGETTFTLPVRPEESETTDFDGSVRKVTVEDILEEGKVVGYKSTTTYYSPDGEIMRTEHSSLYGTTSSSSKQVEQDPVTEEKTVKTTTTETQINEIYTTVSTRDTTLVTEKTNHITTTVLTQEDTYQLVETEEGLFFLYKGTMQPVVALAGHGTTDLVGLTPSATPSSANDLAASTSITNPPSIVDPGNPGSDQFKYVDYGLISDFRVTKADGNNTSEVHLYKLVDHDGNPYYAYCADMDTTAYRKTIYDISNANDENYYQNNQNQDAYAHLLAIAINGYWGTDSGTGSMTAIRQLLKDNNRSDIASTITDGEAMTATQAAIWTFGNKSSTDLVNTGNPARNVSDKTSRENIQALYNILIGDKLKTDTPNTETDIINEENITGATLQLKGKATDENGNVKKDSNGNEKYNTDLTFTLSVEQSALTGNLKLIVKDQYDKPLCDEIQLLTEDSNLLGKALADSSDYSYTIENLEIAEGVTINLNLVGSQNLRKGVYIYTAASGSHEDSQTFIGIAEGTRDVNLQTSLQFTVEDPQLEHTHSETTQTRKDTRVDRKEDHRTDLKADTRSKETITVTLEADTTVKTFGTETVTETKQDITKSSRGWEGQWRYDLMPLSDEDPDDDLPEEPTQPADEPTQPAGESGESTPSKTPKWVPNEGSSRAGTPRTGDLSSVWAVISGLSLSGFVLLNKKRKEE